MADCSHSVTRVPSPAAFFQEALEAYQRIPGQASTHSYTFGPSTLQLEVQSPLLARGFERAFGRGASRFLATCTRVYAWDRTSTGVAFPSPPWGEHYLYTRRGDIPTFQDPRYRISYNVASRVVSMFDRHERIGLYWTEDAETLPGWEQTAPLRTLLHWHGLESGLQLTHAAVIGNARGGLLLAGKGGSGKSTTALACLEGGFSYLSDDYCYCGFAPRPTAYGVYRNARVFPHSLERVPSLQGASSQKSDDKLAIDIAENRPDSLVREMPLTAILLPQVRSEGPLVIRPANQAECLKALALPTMAQLPGAGPESYAILGRLARELPAYSLLLHGPSHEIVSQLRGLLP